MSKLNAKILKNKINYSALILVLIVGLLSFAQKVNSENTACTAPRGEILHITENTNITLCPSTYNTKIIIEGDNIILDCNNAEIVGNYEGAAIQINSGYEQEDILSELENVDLHSVSIEEMYELFNNKQKYENITIKNCIIKNFENGIKGGIIKNLVLENNKITEQQETAVAAIDSIIRNNKIENSYKGFNILGLSNQVINNSVKDIEDVCIGLGGFNNTIEQNKVEKCKYGIVIIGVQNSLKENKAEKNSIGVALWGGGKTEVDRNIANDNQIAGIGIFDSSYNIIENNIANNNRIGIILAGLFSTEPGKNNTIIHNEARNNSEGGIILSDWNFAKLIAGVIPNAGAQNLAEITGTVIYANEMDNNYNIIIEDEKAKNIHNNIIKENNFYNGGVKISEENTKNNIIENNNVIKEKIYLAKISDKILGNVEDIKTGIRDINIEITGIKEGEQISGLHEVKIKDGDRTLVKFDFNFTDNILNLSNIIIEKQKEGDIKGYTYISGVGGVTKTLYLDKINPYLKYVCIKDEEIESISEISNNCHGNNEYLLKCDGLERYGYKCVEEAENYIITGLKHSGVTQSPLSGHFITFQIISQENNNFTFSQNLTILPTHTGIEDNCSEINCDRIFEDYDQYNITLTDGVTPLGTLVLNGVLTATTLSDKTTYAGTSFLWGNATITQTSPQFPYDGEYVVVMESWNNKLGALAIINQTGTQINAIQFIINTSRIMDNEIMIVGTNTIPLDLVEDDKEYAINTDKGIVIIKDAYEAIRYDITNEHEGVYNRTTTIGIINITNQTHNILINGWGKGWYDNLTKEYNKIFYGYILDEEEIVISECNTDNDCDDNDSN
ncbi:MAG: right-handed parallel beta-helix repeat-containing protein, partial [Candidatus Woesearchaeota archaeon]